MKTIKKLLQKPAFTLFIVIVIGLILGSIIRSFSAEIPKADFVVAEYGNLIQEVSVTGRVEPAESVDLAFEKTGRVARVNAQVGDRVFVGQTIVVLANADIIAQIIGAPKEKNPSFLYLHGWVFLEQRNWEAAFENFKLALRVKEPQDWISPEDARSAIAETHLRQGKVTEAIEEYARIDGAPIKAWIVDYMWAKRHYKLGAAYEKIDDPARAKKEYETFLRLWKEADEDLPEVQDAKTRLAKLKGMSEK